MFSWSRGDVSDVYREKVTEKCTIAASFNAALLVSLEAKSLSHISGKSQSDFFIEPRFSGSRVKDMLEASTYLLDTLHDDPPFLVANKVVFVKKKRRGKKMKIKIFVDFGGPLNQFLSRPKRKNNLQTKINSVSISYEIEGPNQFYSSNATSVIGLNQRDYSAALFHEEHLT